MAGALSNIQRLKDHQESKIKNCLERIIELEKLKDDYDALKSRLETISDSLTYSVMVPMSKVAFVPGNLVHTNEILVLLGDNWFVERTAKQASCIAERRLQSCQKMLDDLQKEKQQYSDWLAYTSEVQGNEEMVEIIEEYDEQKEKTWNEQHKNNLKKYKEKLARENQTNEDDTSQKFDRLQLQETREASSSESESSNESTENTGIRQVKWQDQVEKKHMKINFTHSSVPAIAHESEQNMSKEKDDTIQSPADIYKKFSPEALMPQPKSILKNKRSVSESAKTSEPEFDDKYSTGPIIERDVVQAFTGEIVERNISQSDSTTEKSSRPISRFKAGKKN